MFFQKLIISFITFLVMPVYAGTVNYEFDIDYLQVNISGEDVTAMTIDGGIPGPTIEATVGDTLRVTFHNRMEVESSVHWHGILLPNSQDGVPYLTTPPIKAASSFTYDFPITHAGTYWYHSHTGLQEQRGIYGALVFHDKEKNYEYDSERVIVISDWTDEDPKQVLSNLKREDNYYALDKNAVQSWQGVLENGWPAVKNRINSALIRMGPMDISDVAYDAFLINGLQQQHDKALKVGERIRLRIINAGASSYFYVDYAGGDMTIIEADGMPVEPVRVERLRMAIAETFDVIVTVPDSNAYELRATSEDVTGYASLFMGPGEKVMVKDLLKPNPYLMDHSMHGMTTDHSMHGDMNEPEESSKIDDNGHDVAMHEINMDHSMHGDMRKPEDKPKAEHSSHVMHMEHGVIKDIKNIKKVRMLNEYRELRSPTKTAYSADNAQREVLLRLTGSMERYNWSFNDKILTESDRIKIKKGETVRFVLKNETMMHHPIHLHGHFFRVINQQKEYAPLKHTVNVPPFETVTIEFLANEEKDWFFHCHNLYHMKSGMARVIDYDEPGQENFEASEFYRQAKKNGDPWFSFADLSFQSNMVAGEIWAMNTRNTFNLHYDFDYEDEYDIEAYYMRHPTRFFGLFAGANLERESGDVRNVATMGIQYLLPLLLESELRYDSKGQFRFQLMNEHQLTKRVRLNWLWNTDDEYRLEFHYEFNKQISAVVNHDSDFHTGAGIAIHF